MEIESTGSEGAVTEAPSTMTEAPEGAATSEGDGTDAETPEYQPNYKFKAYGKEAEFDEWARGYIKDKETEDRFRQLYAKSHGFEYLKERYKARDSEFNEFKTKHGELEQQATQHQKTLEELVYLRDNDLHGFMEFSKIPFEKLVDYVQARMEHLEDPKKGEAFESAYKARRDAREAQQRAQQIESEKNQLALTYHKEQFNELMDHPEVDDFASRYDSRVGERGAFKRAVAEHGEAHYLRTGETLKPLDAIRAVYKRMKPFVQEVEAQADDESGEEVYQPPQRRKPAAIPNLSGGGAASASPAKKVFKSIEDLKNHAKSLTRD